MKTLTKKLLVTVLAVCMLCTAALGLVSCNGGAAAITQDEFYTLLKASFDNFYAANKDYESIGDFTVTAESEMNEEDKVEWQYTPDGATEKIEATYDEKSIYKAKATYNVKRIGEDLFFSLVYTAERDLVYYDSYMASEDAPLTPAYQKQKHSISLLFGVENGVYYGRVEESLAEGEEALGEATVTKEYTTFASKEEYVEAVLEALEHVDETCITAPYTPFGGGLEISMILMSGLAKYSKEDGVAYMHIGMKLPDFDTEAKDSGMRSTFVNIGVTEKGPVSMENQMEVEYGDSKSHNRMIMEIDYASALTAESNALDGYTENAELDFYSVLLDAYVGFGE